MTTKLEKTKTTSPHWSEDQKIRETNPIQVYEKSTSSSSNSSHTLDQEITILNKNIKAKTIMPPHFFYHVQIKTTKLNKARNQEVQSIQKPTKII